MNKRRWRVIVGVLGFLLLVAVGVLLLPAPKKTVTLDLTGTPGLKVEGTCEVDGEVHDLSGVLPFSKSYQARKIAFSVKRAGEQGELRVAMHVEGGRSGKVGSSDQAVRGHVDTGRVGGVFGPLTFGINTYTPEK